MKNLFDYDELTVRVMDKILFKIYNNIHSTDENKTWEFEGDIKIILEDEKSLKYEVAKKYLFENSYCMVDPSNAGLFYLTQKGRIINNTGCGILAYYLEFTQQKKLIKQNRKYVIASIFAAAGAVGSLLFQLFSKYI